MTIEELNKKIKDFCVDVGGEDTSTILFENPGYETAFIGLDTDYRAVYSYDKMLQFLIENDDMTEEEAADFISYNTIRACAYIQNPPIILQSEFK